MGSDITRSRPSPARNRTARQRRWRVPSSPRSSAGGWRERQAQQT